MAIYIDCPPHTGEWSHLFADTIEELHEFAQRNGIKRCWFENKRGRKQPHYDVRSTNVSRLVMAGAILVGFRDVPQMLKERYG